MAPTLSNNKGGEHYGNRANYNQNYCPYWSD